MKSFESLTPRGKARRLRAVALAALDHYALDVKRLTWVGSFTNTLFRAYTATGASYAVRICDPGWRTDSDLRSEVSWLQSLATVPHIPAPVPVVTKPGEPFVTVRVAPFTLPLRCMVMSWLHGSLLGKHLKEANLAKMGELFARLHTHALTFRPPDGFTTRTMSSYRSRGEPDLLFVEGLVDVAAPRSRDILRRTRDHVVAAFQDLYADPKGLRVIHNDLWHDNIKVYRGRLQPFDFEDTIWGYPVQDIAMAWQDLMTDVSADRYEPLIVAFRDGYARLAPWPETVPDQIDSFRAGRMLWVANFVAQHERAYLETHLEWLTPQLEHFLATGQVRKPAA